MEGSAVKNWDEKINERADVYVTRMRRLIYKYKKLDRRYKRFKLDNHSLKIENDELKEKNKRLEDYNKRLIAYSKRASSFITVKTTQAKNLTTDYETVKDFQRRRDRYKDVDKFFDFIKELSKHV